VNCSSPMRTVSTQTRSALTLYLLAFFFCVIFKAFVLTSAPEDLICLQHCLLFLLQRRDGFRPSISLRAAWNSHKWAVVVLLPALFWPLVLFFMGCFAFRNRYICVHVLKQRFIQGVSFTVSLHGSCDWMMRPYIAIPLPCTGTG